MFFRSVCSIAFLFSAMGVEANPVVPGYEVLKESPIEAGRVLFQELKCFPCHSVDHPFPIKRKTPNLLGLKHRVQPEYLHAFLSDPHKEKPGTAMPDLFAGWDESDRDYSVERIVHFLYSLPSNTTESARLESSFDIDRGEELFHTIGCVACHEPKRKPERVEEGFGEEDDWEIGNASDEDSLSIPLPDLKRKTWLAPLAAFLSDPYHTRPGGRMPDMKLNEEESASIAAFLLEGDPTPPNQFQVNRDKAEEGKRIFHEIGCTNCHSSAGPKEEYSLIAPGLGSLMPGAGCLAEESAKGVPNYRLTQGQQSHLWLAIEEMKSGASSISATATIRHTLASLNCYACHSRDGIGGPSPDRDPFFTGEWSEEMGEEGRIPPTLTGVGSKLTAEWFGRILFEEGGEVRPYLATRMPHYEPIHLGGLPKLLLETDRNPNDMKVDVSGILHHHRNHYGRELIGTDGLSCITCHNLKGHRSLGMPAADLSVVPERLQPEWFKKILLDPTRMNPNTRMPAFFSEGKSPFTKLFGGDAGKQIEALWIYLKEIDQTRLPVGMEKSDQFLLAPKEKPIVHRTFMKGVGPRTIAVGFPKGVHLAFDASKCEVALLWRGAFIDAESAQADRFTPFVSPLGEDIHEYQNDEPRDEYRFLGYRLDDLGVPTFLIESDGIAIEETWTPLEDGTGFERIVHVSGDIATESREEVRW